MRAPWRTLALGAVLTAATPSLAPADGPVFARFDGEMRITQAFGNCPPFVLQVQSDRVSYYPFYEYGGDGIGSALMAFRDDDQFDYILADPLNSSGGSYEGFSLVNGALVQYNGTFNQMVQTPATIDATTAFVTLKGRLNGYLKTGCNVDIAATLTKVAFFNNVADRAQLRALKALTTRAQTGR